MHWFEQTTGRIYRNLSFQGTGYAGFGEGKNNPQMQDVKDVGPLPRGVYKMLEPYDHPRVGKYAITLVAMPENEMFGRDGFFWHGPNAEHPDDSSDGCIVSYPDLRKAAWESGDHMIVVY